MLIFPYISHSLAKQTQYRRVIMMFTCTYDGCRKIYSRIDNLRRHEEVHSQEKKFVCTKCSKGFTRSHNHQRHEITCTTTNQQQPSFSGGSGFRQPPRVPVPTAVHHRNFNIYKSSKAFSNATVTWTLNYKQNDANDYIDLLDNSVLFMSRYLQRYRTKRRTMKFNMSLHVNFEKSVDPSVITVPPAVLVTEQFEVYTDTDIEECLRECSRQLQNRIDCYEDTGSGWIISNLVALDTTIWQLDPLRASTYHPLSTWIRNTKCVVNIKNRNDNMCFKYAVLAGLYKPTDPLNPSLLSSYIAHETAEDAPDFSMLTYPVSLREIDKFERVNDISVNVYGVEEYRVKKKKNQNTPVKEEVQVGVKRRLSYKKPPSKSRRIDGGRSLFLDDEAVLSGDDSSEDESEEEDGNISDLFDDDNNEIEIDPSIYRMFEQRDEAAELEQLQQRFITREGDGVIDEADNETDTDDGDDNNNTDDTIRGVVYPLRITKSELARHVNILLTEKDGVWHYSTIKKFSGFLRSQYSKHMGKYHYCYTCLHGFEAKKGEKTRDQCVLLKEHVKYCKTLKPQRVTYPTKATVEFENINKMLMQPFVGYSDFECTLKPANDVEDVTTGIVPPESQKEKYTEEEYQKHVPVSYFTKFVSIDPEFDLPQKENFVFPQEETYVGEDAAEHYLDYVKNVADAIYEKYIEKPQKMIYTEEDKEKFEAASACHICKKDFVRACLHCHNEEEENEDELSCIICLDNYNIDTIVRDHCHILGHFRGAAHRACNLKYGIDRRRWKLPIFFHNLRGYDGHLLIRAVKERHGKVRVIPNNIEKYMAISIGRVQFLDSLQFTMKSLDDLVTTMDDADFVYTRENFPADDMFHLMKKKGIFPYDLFDDISKLKCSKFPLREAFFNKLEDKECSMEDYLHAKLVWNTFDCKTFREYHDLYLKSDVLLLADLFEKFRRTCMDSYGLDAAHYYSAPGMAWDAALKLTNVKLDLLDNEEMYTFIERSIRGGISQISKRFAKANNRYCPDYNPLKPIMYLIYLDANNLYGWAMSQNLPMKNFRWLTREEIDGIDVESLDDEADTGYIIEVDLKYPPSLHDLHNEYPLAPERLNIDESMLSPFQTRRFPKHQKKPSTRLAPNLYDKTNYVTHYRNLKFYLDQGMIVTKIHRVLAFEQSPWLKKYIDFNTDMRKQSSSEFAKDFYKLMNNSVFGKSQENLRNRVNVEVITKRDVALKRVCKPSFKRSQVIHEDLVIIQTAVSNLVLNKPIFVGFTVLDLSKLLMYKFHYEKMLRWYDDIELCFTDTDSLLYEIQTSNIYSDMGREDRNNEFDFSEYVPGKDGYWLYSTKNKKALGKFKDELNGRPLSEFAGLRSKCLSLLFYGLVKENKILHEKISEKQTDKGIKKSVKKKHLRHRHFKEVLNQLSEITVKQNMIKSKAHSIGTFHQRKTALTCFDTKRWICLDNIHTHAYGHYKTHPEYGGCTE